MRVFFERSRGACVKIVAEVETKCELSSFLFAVERCIGVSELGASLGYSGKDVRRLRHLIASRGLLDRVQCVKYGESISPSPLAEHYMIEGGKSAFLLIDGVIDPT